jgi:hypothetical protein
MAAALMVAVGLLGLLVFLLFGVVLELYRDVRQLREVAGILDRPLEVDVGNVAGSPPSRFGLPAALDSLSSAIVLFLSDRCGTCHALAAGLNGQVPSGLWIVLEARTPESAGQFLTSYELARASNEQRVFVDVAGRIAETMGLRTTPVGFRVEQGRLKGATTVPSRRYLSSILPEPVRLERSLSPSV